MVPPTTITSVKKPVADLKPAPVTKKIEKISESLMESDTEKDAKTPVSESKKPRSSFSKSSLDAISRVVDATMETDEEHKVTETTKKR